MRNFRMILSLLKVSINYSILLIPSTLLQMKFVFILALAAAVCCATGNSDRCLDRNEACHSTDYHSYVNCVRRRHKRSTDCEYSCSSGNCIDTCNSCNCNSCNYNNCDNSCNSCCSSCCSNYIPCQTNHCCHKTCQAQCDNSKCRSNCRKNCYETVRKSSEEIYVPQQTGEAGQFSSNGSIMNNNRHNVTTIIHLNNVINNTNIIDVPININNTNDQNITLYTADNTYSRGAQTEQCCTVIGPRQCVMYPTPKCFHYRSKQCGAYCTADIVHREEKQVCESYYPGAPVNCVQQIYYIPQPTPRCIYQSIWPYVSCGIQRSYVGCEGCYTHYVDQGSSNYLQCSPQCYDGGYQIGPIYRQGPVYRPTYSHAPCYGCNGFPDPYMTAGYVNVPQQQAYVPQSQGYPSYQIFPYQPNYPVNFGPPQEEFEIPLNGTTNGLLVPNSTEILEPKILAREVPVFYPSYNPASKDVQIEMNVEPFPPSQAQVHIKHPNYKKFNGTEELKESNPGTKPTENGAPS